METIIQSEVFDFHKKTYLLDRFKTDGTDILIRITETVHDGSRQGKHVVVFKEAVFERIQQFMGAHVPPRPSSTLVRKRPFFRGDQCDVIKKNYLRGVPCEALAVQYGCKAQDIEAVLRAEGIEIVDPHVASKRRGKRGYGEQASIEPKDKAKGSSMEAARSRHPNAYDRWSDGEDERLLEMYGNGATIEQLMHALGRQRGAINSRLRKFSH